MVMVRATAFPKSITVDRWRDVPLRQRRIGRELRRSYRSITKQQVPEQMMDLLRQADALRRKARFARRSKAQPEMSSVTVAMIVVGALVALYLVLSVASLALSQPATAGFVAFVSLFFAIASAAVWLIEGR
jgi:hypothetical protein